MAMKIVEMKDVMGEEPGSTSPFALLFELEGVAVHGRKAAFEVLKSLLAEQGMPLTPIDFSRYCLYPSPVYYLEDLLEVVDAKKQATEKLVQDVVNGVAMQLASRETTAAPGFMDLVQAARERNIAMAAFSGLPMQTAESLAERLGLGELGVQLFAYDYVEKVFPRADTLLKIAKAISASPRYCALLASSKSSSKAGLAAGMRCIAIPDEFTAFQDFGGVEDVYDGLDQIDARELLDELCPPSSQELAPPSEPAVTHEA